MTDPVDIVIDFETSGFQPPQAVIVQVGAVAVDVASGKFVSQGAIRVRIGPEDIAAFSPQAAEVNGWNPQINATGVPFADMRAQFLAWMGQYTIRGFVAHRAQFDRKIAQFYGLVDPQMPWFCTEKGLKHLDRRGSVRCQDNKLTTLAALAGYTKLASHEALDDSIAAANGWRYILAFGLSPADMAI